jgi:hypothetical protein
MAWQILVMDPVTEQCWYDKEIFDDLEKALEKGDSLGFEIFEKHFMDFFGDERREFFQECVDSIFIQQLCPCQGKCSLKCECCIKK